MFTGVVPESSFQSLRIAGGLQALQNAVDGEQNELVSKSAILASRSDDGTWSDGFLTGNLRGANMNGVWNAAPVVTLAQSVSSNPLSALASINAVKLPWKYTYGYRYLVSGSATNPMLLSPGLMSFTWNAIAPSSPQPTSGSWSTIATYLSGFRAKSVSVTWYLSNETAVDISTALTGDSTAMLVTGMLWDLGTTTPNNVTWVAWPLASATVSYKRLSNGVYITMTTTEAPQKLKAVEASGVGLPVVTGDVYAPSNLAPVGNINLYGTTVQGVTADGIVIPMTHTVPTLSGGPFLSVNWTTSTVSRDNQPATLLRQFCTIITSQEAMSFNDVRHSTTISAQLVFPGSANALASVTETLYSYAAVVGWEIDYTEGIVNLVNSFYSAAVNNNDYAPILRMGYWLLSVLASEGKTVACFEVGDRVYHCDGAADILAWCLAPNSIPMVAPLSQRPSLTKKDFENMSSIAVMQSGADVYDTLMDVMSDDADVVASCEVDFSDARNPRATFAIFDTVNNVLKDVLSVRAYAAVQPFVTPSDSDDQPLAGLAKVWVGALLPAAKALFGPELGIVGSVVGALEGIVGSSFLTGVAESVMSWLLGLVPTIGGWIRKGLRWLGSLF